MKTITTTMVAVCLGLALATTALASQGPPVKIRLMGDPRGVSEGESFKGSLEILMGASARLGSFRFEGKGWHVSRLDAPQDIALDKAGRLEIPFEVEALAGADELQFRFQFDGVTVTKTLNLTRRHFERMTTPAATREVPSTPDPARDPSLPTAGPVPRKPADNGAALSDAEDQKSALSRTINVNGRFIYQRVDGVTMGADGVTVSIYDEDTVSDDLLATVVTDAFGYYSANVSTSTAGENDPDLYLEFEAANDKVVVQDATWEANYSWKTGVWNNFSGSTLNVGWRAPSDESEHPALHICTDISRTWRWLLNHEGYNTPTTDAQWPDGDTGAWYVPYWEEVHISTEHQWNEATHTHEYGHHWVNMYALSVSADYCNGICDFDGDCGHCMWCGETDHDAFSEGFANWMADVLTRSYESEYGIAPVYFRSTESLRTCEVNGLWGNPNVTEGYFGALLRDIEDDSNDDHGIYPGGLDVMSLGTDEIFAVADLDQPTTPAQFLADFRNRYPALKEDLWATARNSGYDFDVAPPGTVTNLGSSSHTIGVSSPDRTIRYTWTRATDDASGIQGYGLYIATIAGMPETVLDIGDVTSYTTPVLSPGNYYFSIRALDKKGNWSAAYQAFGPITVRTAEPSDLASYQPAGWQYPLVPRNDATAGLAAATVSATLNGGTANTYWNVCGINQGESATSTGFTTGLFLDDAFVLWANWGSVGTGVTFRGSNLGTLSVRGGRHALAAHYDATDMVSETNETNNSYGRQFIWTPTNLALGVPVTRAAPPDGQAGWDDITGATLWYDCDGLRTGTPGWWNAVWVRALDNTQNYDARLHAVSTGAEDGFAANLAYSARPAGYLDAVLTNRNVVAETQWDVGVLNNAGGTGNYQAVQVASTAFTFGDSLTVSMGQDDYLDLQEFYVGTANAGFVGVTVDVAPGSGPLTVLWLPSTFATGSLTSYSAAAATADSTGRARLDLTITTVGYHCLAIYRDPRSGGGPLPYTLEIQKTPPDFLPLLAAGWHAPIVPRPAFDGTAGSVALPDTLHGNVASTYLNFAVRNESPSASPSGLPVWAYIDGVYRAWFAWPAFGANTNGLFNWNYAWNFSGGRHTLDTRCDPLGTVEEIHEDNNVYSEQYVWSPLDVAMGTTADRIAPPDRTGGWDQMASSVPLWFNCDGLRMPTRQTWWQAMAVMPAAGSDVDVRLHNKLSGVKNGFAANLTTSAWGLESSDFVLVDYNIAPAKGLDVGVLNAGGASGYTAEHAGSTYVGANPLGALPDGTIESGHIIDLLEVFLDPATLPGGYFLAQLQEVSGNVDWGISLHPAGIDFMGKSTVTPDGAAWAAGPGAGESFGVYVPVTGYYCLAVWKAKSDDLTKTGVYRLIFGNGMTPVGDTLPSATGLTSVSPNPFNPQATIVFNLARPERAELAIYNLQGSLVRTLVSENREAGRHEVVWNGKNNAGQQVASGVYMARLRAGDASWMHKLVLVK